MNEKKLEGLLIDSIMCREELIDRCTTFEEGLILTNNKGFTLRAMDGSEFQVTIVQSKQGKDMTCVVCSEDDGEEYEDEYTDGKVIMCSNCIDNHMNEARDGTLSK